MTLSSNFALKRGGGGRNNEGGVTTREYGICVPDLGLDTRHRTRDCFAFLIDFCAYETGVDYAKQ